MPKKILYDTENTYTKSSSYNRTLNYIFHIKYSTESIWTNQYENHKYYSIHESTHCKHVNEIWFERDKVSQYIKQKQLNKPQKEKLATAYIVEINQSTKKALIAYNDHNKDSKIYANVSLNQFKFKPIEGNFVDIIKITKDNETNLSYEEHYSDEFESSLQELLTTIKENLKIEDEV